MRTSLEVVLNALREWSGVPTVAKVPRERPNLFIRVDAGPQVALSPASDRTMIIAQVYGTDLEQVLELIGQIRDYLRFELSIHVPDVSGWDEESGPHEMPDPDIPGCFRWQLAGQLFTTLT